MATKNFCVHGHFYQPPREDPETGQIPNEESAGAFSNWNEKITALCYAPNAVLGNFGRISFDLGPTLAGWLEKTHPDLHSEIVAQEADFFARTGVSNAMAQSYNHTILPLSNRADKETQIRWGIADYIYRFGHEPLGLWAPETAIDTETLEVMAENKIQFTILAPWQADAPDDFDVSHPYRVKLPSGAEIIVFFFAREPSLKVSFDADATVDANNYINDYILPLFPIRGRVRRTFLIASDGELYGHHQPRREEFLQWLTTGAAEMSGLTPVVPAQLLTNISKLPKIKLRENTSWSCEHELKRWCGECACTVNGVWKAPLRDALNFLADVIDLESERMITRMGLDFQNVRNDYSSVLIGTESAREFALRHLGNASEDTLRSFETLMTVQYERQRMFTSCGWFFDDFDRIEPKNNLRYASRAVRLFDKLTGTNLHAEMRERLRSVSDARTGLSADQVI